MDLRLALGYDADSDGFGGFLALPVRVQLPDRRQQGKSEGSLGSSLNAAKQTAAADALANSPRSAQQRHRIAELFGNAAQRKAAPAGTASGPSPALAAPAQTDNTQPLQLLTEAGALEKLGIPSGEDAVVAMLIQLSRATDAIPVLEQVLRGFDTFVAKFPQRRSTLLEPIPPRSEVRYEMGGTVKKLSKSLPTLIDTLGDIEDWYLGAAPEERGLKARTSLGEVETLAGLLSDAKLLGGLLQAAPMSLAALKDHAGRRWLRDVSSEIDQWIGSDQGGFSAVGRAAEITTSDGASDDDGIAPAGLDDAFLGGYFRGLDSPESLAEVHPVAKPQTTPEGGGPLLVDGHQPKVDMEAQQRAKWLSQVESGMVALENGGALREFFQAPPAPRDRGKGQLAAMNRTNANGYAWLTGTAGWDQNRWEWLHIRAASLGGVTDGRNLVLGTRDANTLMMPFEANIRLLAGIVRDHPHLQALDVEWSVEGGQGHRYETLRINWFVDPTQDAPDDIDALAEQASGSIEVANLYNDTRLSKDEVRLIEGSLTGFRETLRPSQ